MIEDKAFSSIDFVGQCLIDKKRSLAFEKAIKKQIGKNSHVLDLGTGSGIMALFAARAGAEKVTGIEFDPFIASVAVKNINANKFEKVISVKICDAREVKLHEKIDVVIMEMLTTGMVDEFQVQAINNLHKQKLITADTVLIPNKQDTFVTMGYLEFTRYGFKLPTIRHLWKFHDKADVKFIGKSKKTLLNSIVFSKPVNETIEEIVEFRTTKAGAINSIELSSITHLGRGLTLGDTDSINAPVAIPIEEFSVKKGDKVKFKIKYKFGHGYNSLEINRII